MEPTTTPIRPVARKAPGGMTAAEFAKAFNAVAMGPAGDVQAYFAMKQRHADKVHGEKPAAAAIKETIV